MNIQIPQKIKNIMNKMNQLGIPLPMLRDCLTKKPSLTYTLTLLASILVTLGVCHIGSIDYNRAVTFLQLVGGGYLARQTMKHISPLPDNNNQTNTQGE